MLDAGTLLPLPATTRQDALDAPVRFLPGWHLDLRCAACGEAFALELDGLDRERRLNRTVRDVARRAACPRCEAVPTRAELVSAGQREQLRIPVRG